MAIGNAVLDVIKEDSLQENSLIVGGYLKDQLDILKEKHGCIGDVRGVGLMMGIELVTNKDTKVPFKDLAEKVMQL